MNIVNRLFMVLLMLGLIVLLTILFIFPGQIMPVMGQFLLDWGQYFAWVDGQNQLPRLAMSIGLAFVVDLILALLIFLEIKPKRKRFIKVEQVSGGTAMVSLDSITRQLLYRLDSLPGVVRVTPAIRPKGDKIQASMDVIVTREQAVPQMAGQLIATAQQALAGDLGLVIAGEPQVRIKIVDGVRQDSVPYSPKIVPEARTEVPSPVLVPTPDEPVKSDAVNEKDKWA